MENIWTVKCNTFAPDASKLPLQFKVLEYRQSDVENQFRRAPARIGAEDSSSRAYVIEFDRRKPGAGRRAFRSASRDAEPRRFAIVYIHIEMMV